MNMWVRLYSSSTAIVSALVKQWESVGTTEKHVEEMSQNCRQALNWGLLSPLQGPNHQVNPLSTMPHWNCLQVLSSCQEVLEVDALSCCFKSDTAEWNITVFLSEGSDLVVSKFDVVYCWISLKSADFTTVSKTLFHSSLPISAWGRYVELLSRPRKTARKLYHEHVVLPKRCFSIGKSMKRWKKNIAKELRKRLWSNASWMRRWERYSKTTKCW